MFRDPQSLAADLDVLEDIERASLRLVAQALIDFSGEAAQIFAEQSDLQADIGEDITEEALTKLGVSGIPYRLPGKMDYKRARYVFHPAYAIRQALLVDSKAEKSLDVARIQVSQTSMRIKQVRAGRDLDVQGTVPPVIHTRGHSFVATTIFVKYFYERARDRNTLDTIRVACLPNGMLQKRYNPSPRDTIWRAGPDAPTRGEKFRTRLNFRLLARRAAWRVQDIRPDSADQFRWNE